ncbi:helix-turn-helix domain-containing protein [Erwinia rhapontici]|uniref:TetR/AcrR family transcriptional regulator n=1 Tax=Erwinia rhapontici TaxID=55212 RepID=UPI00307DE4CF
MPCSRISSFINLWVVAGINNDNLNQLLTMRIDSKLTDRQLKIIHAARNCMVRNGLVNTTVSDISEESKFAIGQIYRCFARKEEIVREVLITLYKRKLDKLLAMCNSFADIARGLSDNCCPLENSERKLLLEFITESIHNTFFKETIYSINMIYTKKLQKKLKVAMPFLTSTEITTIAEMIFIIYDGVIVRENTDYKHGPYLESSYLKFFKVFDAKS